MCLSTKTLKDLAIDGNITTYRFWCLGFAQDHIVAVYFGKSKNNLATKLCSIEYLNQMNDVCLRSYTRFRS